MELKDLLKGLCVIFGIVAVILVVLFELYKTDKEYNSTPHNQDVNVTEWVSPDGVHYWYQQSGYHAMLAPRYDSNGNLVIE